MKKILSACIIFCMSIPLASAIIVSSALPVGSLDGKNTETYTPPVYPEGESFVKLKSLIDTTFVPQTKRSYYSQKCISSGWLCPNYKYTSLTEKAIKFIIIDTFTGNETFYTNLFNGYSGYSYSEDSSVGQKKTAKEILKNIPKGTPVINDVGQIFSLGSNTSTFGTNYSEELVSSSFGIDYTENTSSNSMLGAIEAKIKEMKRTKCQKLNTNSGLNYDSGKCPWNGDISNQYLPTEEELHSETIYLNGRSVKVETLKDEFEYKVEEVSPEGEEVLDFADTTVSNDGMTSTLEIYFNGTKMGESQNIRETEARESCNANKNVNLDKFVMCMWDGKILSLESTNQKPEVLIEKKYTLKYRKDTYTLVEAQKELDKKEEFEANIPVLSSGNSPTNRLPCLSGGNYLTRSECASATANLNSVATAIGAYYSDYEKYPDTIDKLNQNYLPKGLGDFKKNFEYKLLTGATTFPEYAIYYIGNIGKEGGDLSTEKKDYVALLSGATVPEIPGIFAHAPSDSMVLYIKNPQNLFALLNLKSNSSTRLSGIDVSDTIKGMMQDFFELKDFSTLEKHLKHEVLLVVENLDLSAPDITMILSEADRDALAPSAQARVVGSKDGYIYISNSKASIEKYMNLSLEKSLSSAPDFRYVWAKKSALIQDAYMYVGDAFFEKMLTLETYITHYRKYRDLTRLGKFQELVWAYQDAYGTSPESLQKVLEKTDSEIPEQKMLQEYTISDGILSSKSIGTLRSIKTLPEVGYDLSVITRSELEDYKINILKYRDVWRASLDPMGIVMNRYGDGMEIDFFMTPIPHLDADFESIRALFEGTSKDSLSFLSNPKIRMGLLSFVVGLDMKKLEGKIAAVPELQSGIKDINTELLDGRNVFEFLAGEGAFSIGNIPSDILDGWNVEKIDAYFSLQLQSEEKGKELIDIIRKKLLADFGDTPSGGYIDMKSFLAKPLIEDYEGKQIFYVEAIPVPFVGKIGFAYTFIDDYFFIGLNRTTMKRVIDVAKTGDTKKRELIDESTAPKGSFFVTLFDGESASVDLHGLYEKNRTSIPRYASLLDRQIMNGSDPISPVVSTYYVGGVKTKRLGKSVKSLTYTLGGLSLKETSDDIRVYLDKSLHESLSGTTLQIWNNLSTDERFPKALVEDDGMNIDDFLKNTMKSEILSLELIIQLDRAFLGTESLLRNSTLSVGMGENEIGFITRVFRDKGLPSPQNDGMSIAGDIPAGTRYFLFGFIGLMLLLGILGGGYILFQKRKEKANILTPVTPTPSGTWIGSSSVSPAPLNTGVPMPTATAPIILSPSTPIATGEISPLPPSPPPVVPPSSPSSL